MKGKVRFSLNLFGRRLTTLHLKANGSVLLTQTVSLQMAKCVELDRRVQQMDEEMMVNPQFIKKQLCSSTDDDLTAITPGLASGGPSNSTI